MDDSDQILRTINNLFINPEHSSEHIAHTRNERTAFLEMIIDIISGQGNTGNSRFKPSENYITNVPEHTVENVDKLSPASIVARLIIGKIKANDVTFEQKYSIANSCEQTIKKLLESGDDKYKSVDNALFDAVRRKWHKKFEKKIIENAIYVSDKFLLLGESVQKYTYKCQWVWLPQQFKQPNDSNDVLSPKLQKDYYLGFFLISSEKANLDQLKEKQNKHFLRWKEKPVWMEFPFYTIGEVIRSDNDVWRFKAESKYIYEPLLGTSRKKERLGASIHNGFVQAINIHLQKNGHSPRLCENRRHQFDRVGYCKYIKEGQAISKDLQQCLSKIDDDHWHWQQRRAMSVISEIAKTM